MTLEIVTWLKMMTRCLGRVYTMLFKCWITYLNFDYAWDILAGLIWPNGRSPSAIDLKGSRFIINDSYIMTHYQSTQIENTLTIAETATEKTKPMQDVFNCIINFWRQKQRGPEKRLAIAASTGSFFGPISDFQYHIAHMISPKTTACYNRTACYNSAKSPRWRRNFWVKRRKFMHKAELTIFFQTSRAQFSIIHSSGRSKSNLIWI